MEWNQLIWLVPPAIGGLLIGHIVGARNGRKSSKRSLQKLNQQSLELLDAKSEILELKNQSITDERRERLLALAMKKLQLANKEIRALQAQIESENEHHVIEVSALRLRAEEACETARKACEIAVDTTARLDIMSRSSNLTRTTDHKLIRSEDSVASRIDDRARGNRPSESLAAVVKRDRAELTELHDGKQAGAL